MCHIRKEQTMIDYAKLMAQATVLRKQLGEDDSSPIDIFSLVQGVEGLTLVYYPMGEKLSGMCIKSQKGNNLIAINSAMTIGRQRFSLAHELYHLYFDSCMMSVCGKRLNYGKEVERSADMFASYFLMPEAALIAFAGRIIEKRHPDAALGRSNGIGNCFGFLVVTPYAAEGPPGISGIICRGGGAHEVRHVNGTQFLAGSGKG